jgi:hypothetical protein
MRLLLPPGSKSRTKRIQSVSGPIRLLGQLLSPVEPSTTKIIYYSTSSPPCPYSELVHVAEQGIHGSGQICWELFGHIEFKVMHGSPFEA